jgi:hypothetical protein
MLAVAREVTHRYVDPLTEVWLGAARRIGLRIVRTPDAYAATDGGGTLAIGTDATLDADDSLAQMIFHELCHSLVEGEAAFARPDWGMDNTGPDHDWREHACLRLQWVLAGRHGLRALLAPTTDFRAFWDQLAGDVLADRCDVSVQSAIAGLRRVDQPPWAPALDEALAATAQIAAVAARFSPAADNPVAGRFSLAADTPAGAKPAAAGFSPAADTPTADTPAADKPAAAGPRSLWLGVTPPPAPHPTGLPPRTAGDGARCGTCAWRHNARCRQAGARVDPAWPACERFEAALDCQTCGACCRAAYHSVEVSRRDPVVKAHPSLIVDRGSYLEIRRAGDRCAALEGGAVDERQRVAGGGDPDGSAGGAAVLPRGIEHGTTTRYHCAIYGDRPRTCRDFTLGSAHCLTARRRVGLSL